MHDERPVWIALNGVRCIVLSCSPHDPVPLAVGHLLAEGWISAPAELTGIQVTDAPAGTTGVLANVEPELVERMQMLQRHQTIHGCGLRHVLDCDPFALLPVPAAQPPHDAGALLRELFEHSEGDGGGVHSVALSDGSSLRHFTQDIARHCAVDRAIGAAVLADASLEAHGLVTTARVTAAMALKAVRSRLGWIASRSIATSLAHEIASHYGVVLLERAGRRAT